MDRFAVDDPDEDWSFEVDRELGHLFKHPGLGLEAIGEVWPSDPLFHPAKPSAHWLMVGEIAGRVLVVPPAPSRSGDRSRCRPIGCYAAAEHLVRRYWEDR